MAVRKTSSTYTSNVHDRSMSPMLYHPFHDFLCQVQTPVVQVTSDVTLVNIICPKRLVFMSSINCSSLILTNKASCKPTEGNAHSSSDHHLRGPSIVHKNVGIKIHRTQFRELPYHVSQTMTLARRAHSFFSAGGRGDVTLDKGVLQRRIRQTCLRCI
eukprot:767529-Hanusia_phi.AAC.11